MPDQDVQTNAKGGLVARSIRVRPWHKHVAFGGMAAGWLLIAYLATRSIDMHVLQAGAGMLFFGLLVFVALAYAGTMRREYALAVFESKGWIHSLLSRRFLRACAWLLFAVAMAFALFLQLHAYSAVEWAALSSVLIVFPLTFAWFRRATRAEMREDMADSMALILALRTCPAIVAALYVLAAALVGDLPKHESLEASIEAYRTTPIEWSGSELIRQGLYWAAYFDGLKAYAVSHVGELWALPALVLLVVAKYAIFLGACLALTPLLVSVGEFRRARMVPRWSTGAVALAAVAVTGTYALNGLDRWVTDSQRLRDLRVTVEKMSIELIDGNVHREGTRADVLALAPGAAQRIEAEVDVLRDRLDAMFETLERDAVAEYLDWYYSPTGAALRLAGSVKYVWESLVGESSTEEIDNHMTEHLRAVFGRQFPDVNAAHVAIQVALERESLRLGRDARDILAENRLVPVPRDYKIAWEGSLDNMIEAALPEGIIPPGAAGATVGAGVLSTMVARRVVASVSRQPALKRAGGSLRSALATATKGLAGGLAAFLGIEWMSMKFDEWLSRDEFERQLVGAVQEARRGFEQRYFGLSDDPPPREAAASP